MGCPEGLHICFKIAIIIIVSCKGEYAQRRTDSDVLCRLQITGCWCPRAGCLEEKEEGTGENCIMKSFMICSANIISVIRSIRMRWAGHVTRMGEKRNVYRASGGNLKERDHLADSSCLSFTSSGQVGNVDSTALACRQTDGRTCCST